MTNPAKAHCKNSPMVKQKAQTHDGSHALKITWPTYSQPTISPLDPSLILYDLFSPLHSWEQDKTMWYREKKKKAKEKLNNAKQ